MGVIKLNGKAYGGGGGGGNANIVELTQAEYDALPESKLTDGILYCITDGEGDVINFVNGVYIDTSNVIVPETQYTGSVTYTATQDCAVTFTIANNNNSSADVTLDGEPISVIFGVQINLLGDTVFVKKGQTLVIRTSFSSADVTYKVYGVQTGSVSNAQHNYSTSDQVIGTWIDGKPLYQRTWNNLTVSISANTWANTGISATDIDTIVDGTMQDDNKQKISGTIGFMSSHTYIGVYPQIGNRDLKSLTIQYTKTTD